MKHSFTPSILSRKTILWLPCLLGLGISASLASALTLIRTDPETQCTIMSGSWSSGDFPYGGYGSFLSDSFDSDDIATEFFVESINGDNFSVTGFFTEFTGFDKVAFEGFGFNGFHYPDGRNGNLSYTGTAGRFGYEFSALFTPSTASSNGGGTWSGAYKVYELDCEPTQNVPEGGFSFVLLGCSLGAVVGARRVMAKYQKM